MRQKAPTDPSVHTRFDIVAAALDAESAFQHSDSAFDGSTPTLYAWKRGAVSHLLQCGRQWTLSWQGDTANAEIVRELIVIECEEGTSAPRTAGARPKPFWW